MGISGPDPAWEGPTAKASIGKPLRAETNPNAVVSFMVGRIIKYMPSPVGSKERMKFCNGLGGGLRRGSARLIRCGLEFEMLLDCNYSEVVI